ncbi:MAG: hypothetical protein QOK24_2813 [Verrucomicrobiota bacterium]|jgi:hypothetical protein
MKFQLVLRAVLFAGIVSLVSHPLVAADSAAQIDAKLKAGGEVAWVIKDSTNADGDLAVLFTARNKGSKPAKFPYLVSGVAPAETDALNGFDEAAGKIEDRIAMGNAVVSLKEKRVLGRLDLGKPEDQIVYFPGRNHGSLQVLWGPAEEGWHFGVLIFGAKWESTAVLLVESDGENLRQLNIKPTLDARATALLKTALKGKKNAAPTRYAISYNQMSVVDPDVGYSVGNPVTVKIGVSAEIPKGPDDAPYVEASMTVLLETSRERISAKVLKAESAKK